MAVTFKAVLFDMDGVIVDNNDFHRKAWQLFLKRHGMELNDNDYNRKISGRLNAELMRMLFGNHLSDEETNALGEEKEQIYRDLYEHHLRPVNGLPEFLKLLKNSGIKIAVGTSAPLSNLDFIIDGIGIRHYFDALVHQGMVTKGKPDPQVYQICMKKLNVTPQDSLIFEDSISGIQAGLVAQARVVGVTTTHKNNELKNTLINIKDYREEQLRTILPCLGQIC